MKALRRLLPAVMILAVPLLFADPAEAVTVNGFVKTTGGAGVASVNLDVFDSATGAFVFIINDLTGANGFYQIVLNPGTYDITYSPPAALHLAAFKRSSVVVAGTSSTIQTLPDTVLEPGFLVSGHVQDTLLPPNPAANVEIRFFDSTTKLSVFAAANTTNTSGDFSILVPARTYDIDYAPAVGDTLLPVKVPLISVAADRSVPTVSLSRGFLLEGNVQDPTAAAVFKAETEIFDAFTGSLILTVHRETDAAGHFKFAVPAGILDMDVLPPPGPALAATSVRGIVVSGPTVLAAPVVLPAGMTLTGRVLQGGAPAAGVNLTLVDLDTGKVYPTPRDNTDALGNYLVNVPPGLYDVRFNAVVGSGFASAILPEVAITANLALPDTVLPLGHTLSGRFMDADAPGGPVPVAGVGYIVFDDISGKGFPAAGNPTLADGLFTLTLPPGKWVLEPLQPRGSPLLTRKLAAADLTAGNVALGDVLLSRGVALTGRVLDTLGAIRDVDLNVNDALGNRLITPRDRTDPLGNYSIFVPDHATYSVEYNPPRATDLAALSIPGVAVSGPTARPDVTLPRGVVVTGRVLDPLSIPVYNVGLNVYTALGVPYLTPHDTTLSNGTFKVVLPPGGDATAQIHFLPPRGSRLLLSVLTPLNLTADINLGDVSLVNGLLVTGQVTRPGGTGVRDVNMKFFDSTTLLILNTPHNTTDGAGNYVVAVPAGTYNVECIPPPPLPAGDRLIPVRQMAVPAATDVSGLNFALLNGIWAKGLVRGDGLPLAAANLDFIHPDGTNQFAPQGKTDLSGAYSLALPPDTYTVTVASPVGSRLVATLRAGVDLHADNPAIPAFDLFSGYFLSGFVVNGSAQPVAKATVDVADPLSGATVLAPNNTTDNTGFFKISLAPGVYNLRICPPSASSLPCARRDGVVVSGDTVLSNTVLGSSFRIDGKILNSGTTPVPGAEADFFLGSVLQPAQGNVADVTGKFRTFVPPGTYTVVFNPPAGSGLAPLTRTGVVVAGDQVIADAQLAGATNATLLSVSPPSGPAAGGGSVTLAGSAFAAGASVLFGKVSASVTSLTATSITVTLPAHPPGPADVQVINPGAIPATLADAFQFIRRVPDIPLTVIRSGDDLILTWTSTGQGTYIVFRSATAAGIRAPFLAGTTGVPTFTLVGGAHPSTTEAFYDVE